MHRRSLLLAAPSLALAGEAIAAGTNKTMPPPGVEAQSLSVQISASSDDAITGFVFRYCAYPDQKVVWIWANVFIGGEVYTFTDDALPLDHALPELAATDVRYRLESGCRLELSRRGARAHPDEGAIQVSFRGTRGQRVPHGAGHVPIRITAKIVPSSANERNALLPGRTEAKGIVEAEMTVGDRKVGFKGFGSWHEQPQSRPRFVDPFIYFRGSGEGIAFTFSQYPGDSAGGYLTLADTTEAIKSFKITPPSQTRYYRAEFASGKAIQGEVSEVYRFAIPIYDTWRESQIVRGHLEGKPYVGAINDFMGEKISYLSA